MARWVLVRGVWVIGFCLGAGFVHNIVAQESKLDFARDIRPILSNKCFICHGPDANTRESGFRLDVKESAFGEADSGERPIVPGDLEASELLRRIVATDSEKMPPEDSELVLSKKEIDLVREWIQQGAPWQDHWAFVSPVLPNVPTVQNKAWPRNPIDYFAMAKMESLNLEPSQRARKEVLVRRLYFDLIGIPPSPHELDRFLNDSSENAYENLVDRLLASPHYGEHMASDWLDAARFADTNGYQNDFSRSMWPWRDWVINAFNENMPFDQFTVEQIAGDLLPNATLNQIIATGFNRNHRTVTEGGSIEQEWHVENIVDRVETTSTVFMGLTMGCARCHDHKYDPISQREFYQFFAFFNSINEKGVHNETRGNVPPLVKVPSSEHRAQLAKIDQRIDESKTRISEIEKQQSGRRAQWESDLRTKVLQNSIPPHAVGLLGNEEQTRPESVLHTLGDAKSKHIFVDALAGQALKLTPQKGAPLALPDPFDFDGTKPFSCSAWVKPDSYGAIVSRMDKSDAYRGFDMLISGDGHLDVHLIHNWPSNAIKISTGDLIPKQQWTHVAVTYDGTGKSSGFKIYFNRQPIEFKVQSDSLNGSTLTKHPFWVGLRGATPPFRGLVSDIRIFNQCLNVESVFDCFDQRVGRMVESSNSDGSAARQKHIEALFLASSDKGYVAAVRDMNKLRRQRVELDRLAPTVMIMEELAVPRKTYVLARGQYDKPILDDPVRPGFPAFLPPPPESKESLNRLDLAKWLTRPNNPLLARVTVNRFWNRLFGIGLLDSTENFGVQSSPPSHQKLLDWLAVTFIESGWDVKRLHKTIVMSATYRQSSDALPESFTRDPQNRLLARGGRFRLPAESIRDNALAISGLLEPRIGGKSIKPYQPEGLWQELAGGAGEKPYVQDTDSNLYRRSMYIYRKRTVPHSTMSTFDAASRDICQVARQRTNTPLQALALLNDTTYAEAARQLATFVIRKDRAVEKRIRTMFRRATSRLPSTLELEILEKSLRRSHDRFEDSPELAKKFVSVGNSPVDDSLNAVELAAYTVVASVILNLDETITRE